jgi:hypothetical protein
MSTHSAIGYQNRKDDIHVIYCHYDGYPSHVGRLLVQHWNSMSKCNQLVYNGAIRSFEQNGDVDRFNDEQGYENYESVQEIIDSGFDYCYLFNEDTGRWVCYGRETVSRKVVECDIPGNEPKQFETVLKEFIDQTYTKFQNYGYAAGYMQTVLQEVTKQLPQEAVNELIAQIAAKSEELK